MYKPPQIKTNKVTKYFFSMTQHTVIIIYNSSTQAQLNSSNLYSRHGNPIL